MDARLLDKLDGLRSARLSDQGQSMDYLLVTRYESHMARRIRRSFASTRVIWVIRVISFISSFVITVRLARPMFAWLLFWISFGTDDQQKIRGKRNAITRDKVLKYIIEHPLGPSGSEDAQDYLAFSSADHAAKIEIMVRQLANGVALASLALLLLALIFEAFKDRLHRQYSCWTELTGNGHTVAWRMEASGLQALVQPRIIDKDTTWVPVRWVPVRLVKSEPTLFGNPYARAAGRSALWGVGVSLVTDLLLLWVLPVRALLSLTNYRDTHDGFVSAARDKGFVYTSDIVGTRFLVQDSAADARSALLSLSLAFGAVLVALLGLILAWRRRRPPFGEAVLARLAVQVVGIRNDGDSWEARVVSLIAPRVRLWCPAEYLGGIPAV